MLFRSLVLRARFPRELNSASSSLYRATKAAALHERDAETFSELAGLDLATPDGSAAAAARLRRKLLSSREEHSETTMRLGRAVADRARSMSDGEWESVPLKEKKAFAAFIGLQLREAPGDVSEQLRRRYFETSMENPANMNFGGVKDTYQRLKLGLPVEIHDPKNELGVAQAIYEAADAELFDPKQSHKLENAMNHVKQLFVDYIEKKRQGVSTELERRRLANLSAELNYQTQRHLANMFKYAEKRVQDTILREKQAQLKHIAAIQEAVSQQREQAERDKTAPLTAADLRSARASKARKVLRDVYGLDSRVAGAILKEMKAQEDFLRKCEVLLRIVHSRGFKHTPADETLDTYTASLRQLYGMDPSKLATVDAARYMAAKEELPPLDWAKRWYERALLLPLQQTPEFETLERLRREKAEINAVTNDVLSGRAQRSETGQPKSPDSPGDAEKEAVTIQGDFSPPEVVNLVEKMFLPPDDDRLQSLHERRLRYVAYLHIQSQIRRMRANAQLFEGIETAPGADEVRALYDRAMQLKKEVESKASSTTPGEGQEPNALTNPFSNRQLQDLFDRIMAKVDDIIAGCHLQSEAERRARRLRTVIAAVKGGRASALAEEAYRTIVAKKQAMLQRLLGLLERDAREDALWVENMMEAERPPLLPVPEPMSYVSAADIEEWRALRQEQKRDNGSPFAKRNKNKTVRFNASFLGQAWEIPDRPLLFWGTGTAAVQQALKFAAEDAERQRHGAPLAPSYPCPENPWGWRLREDPLNV